MSNSQIPKLLDPIHVIEGQKIFIIKNILIKEASKIKKLLKLCELSGNMSPLFKFNFFFQFFDKR